MKLRPRKPVNYAVASTDSAFGSPAQPPAPAPTGSASGSPARPPAVGVGAAPGSTRQDTVTDWIHNTSAPGASLPDPPSTPENLAAAMKSFSIGGTGRRQQTESNYSSNPDPDPDSPEKNSAVKDEQIVNTALIILLNLLTLAFEEAQGEWSLYQQPFCMRDRNAEKVFEARVDGIYTVEDKVVSIVEVKPYDRSDSDDRIYRRLLLSQDKDQVFCTVASFSPAYVRYICDRMGDEQLQKDEGFLSMDQEGPFKGDSSLQEI
ncbi:hypothetical protein ISF_04593 [Cordyceps fumosorosea ARSEF 2679]|uniref:Uncharacterized protein n=1 Tax=Cordyceps fumosorosea (strain ARSEF 2679) TaxID=1081104 RepID=A0A167WJV9_CORFA|nr:hypothetical protein ISF_04593 [Cordyceps fumosorosea ARSEF 2679]OAA63884.1 hypothetical protein ISF_04593 [Cordyceps fumosorosea ARSEF 2679]